MLLIVGMQNFHDVFEARKQSFISAVSICMTVPLITYSLAFFTSHSGISAKLITITNTSLLNELLDMTMHREVNIRHKHINLAKKTLIFEYFSAKFCHMLFEMNKLILSCLDGISL